MSSKHGRDVDARPPKMVLICPSCGHESPLTGDWQVRQRRAGSTATSERCYVCPDCSAVVTRRPDSVVD